MFDPITDSDLNALKRDHEEVFEVSACGAKFILRLPTEPEYQMFRRRVQESKDGGAESGKALVRLCVLYPHDAALESVLRRRPALGDTLQGQILKLAGLDPEASGKVV